MNRPGDWHCRSCQHLNFQRRESCQRCGESKFAREFSIFSNNRGRNLNLNLSSSSSSSSSLFGSGVSPGSDVRPGDWYCNIGNCGTHNFASRSSCFKCGGLKDDYEMINRGVGSLRFGSDGSRGASSWKSGDWICTRSGCNEHNFASRMECFRCNAPRDSF